MTTSQPRFMAAEEREAGTLCAKCSVEISLGTQVAICSDCGAMHHESCWTERGVCSDYECSGSIVSTEERSSAPLMISRQELAATEPLPPRVSPFADVVGDPKKPNRTWNRASIWALVVALLGIPLFGLITGLIAILIACIALVTHHENRRGLSLAIVAMVIGFVDVVGWAVALSSYFGTSHTAVSLAEMALDPTSMDNLPDYIARAMRANVLIQIDAGFGQGSIGSGVVLKVKDDLTYIITNRHVVDRNYSDSTTTAPKDMSSLSGIMVMSVSQLSIPGVVEWVAPHGVDLALVSANFSRNEVQEARWNSQLKPHVGDEVFAVGNPHGLGWTHTSGSVSQIRRRTRGNMKYRILQTSAPINPGNSGGGLYDAEGNLLGINTFTAEKRFAEGLGFSIALPTLFDLLPDRFGIRNKNVKEAVE